MAGRLLWYSAVWLWHTRLWESNAVVLGCHGQGVGEGGGHGFIPYGCQVLQELTYLAGGADTQYFAVFALCLAHSVSPFPHS